MGGYTVLVVHTCTYVLFAVPLKAPIILSANRTEANRVLVK